MPEPTNSGASTASSGILGALRAAELACRKCNAALERFTAALVSPTIEIAVLTKKGGPLTKQICLTEEGRLRSDGSACAMSRGVAQRTCFDTLSGFAEYISTLGSNKAIALGALKSELPDAVEVVTKNRLEKRSLQTRSAVISRTREYLDYREATPALALIDFDTKGMPRRVQDRIEELGGPLAAVMVVLPGLAGSGHVIAAQRALAYGEQIPISRSAVLTVYTFMCLSKTAPM